MKVHPLIFTICMLLVAVSGFVPATRGASALSTEEPLELSMPVIPRGDVEVQSVLEDATTTHVSVPGTRTGKSLDTRSTRAGVVSAVHEVANDNERRPDAARFLRRSGNWLYRNGHFSRALETWWKTWEHGKASSDSIEEARQAFAEWASLMAKLGRREELASELRSIDALSFTGAAGQKLREAREGLNFMNLRPDLSYRCGPAALSKVLAKQNGRFIFNETLANAPSTHQGISLKQLKELSDKAGLKFQVARRDAGAEWITPSVVHWKLNHYAALTERKGDKFHIEDSTFSDHFWVAAEALEAECSGYFLVPDGPLPSGWHSVELAVAAEIWGRGQISNQNRTATRTSDYQTPAKDPCGMAVYNAHLHLCSLRIVDTPQIWHSKSGVEMPFTVTYNEKDAGYEVVDYQFGHFSPQWTHNWHSFVTFDSSNAEFKVRLRGGGQNTYAVASVPVLTLNQTTNTATAPDKIDGTYLNVAWIGRQESNLVVSKPTRVVHVFPDGSLDIYETAQSDATAFFLTWVIPKETRRATSAYGVKLNYETHTVGSQTGLRLVGLAEPAESTSVIKFYYSDTPNLTFETNIIPPAQADSWQILAIKDVAGRITKFSYDATQRLTGITDAEGLHSSVGYEAASDRIISLTTAYGTSTFTRMPLAGGDDDVLAWLEMRDPMGLVERLEFNQNAYAVGRYDFPEPDANKVLVRSSHTNEFRNTFYWGKKAMYHAPRDYNAAEVYHWMHDSQSQSAAVLESFKSPLEGRIYFDYPGMAVREDATWTATASLLRPATVARVLDDGTTQIYKFKYNVFGNLERAIDPKGRQQDWTYANDNVRVVKVTQRSGTSDLLLARYNYTDAKAPLLPSEVIDSAGGATLLEYNTFGQVTSIENPAHEVTSLLYWDNIDVAGFGSQNWGRLRRITRGNPSAMIAEFEPDAANRVRKVTDSTGYSVERLYDGLDRITQILYPGGRTEMIDYGQKLFPESFTDSANRVWKYKYNPNQQLVGILAAGELTRIQWCACGALGSVTDPSGATTEWQYDIQGRLLSKQYPDGATWKFKYTSLAGRLESTTKPDLSTITFEYDADDALTKVDYSDVGTADLNYKYDPVFPRLTDAWLGTSATPGPDAHHFEYHPYATDGPNPVYAVGGGQLSSRNGPWANDTVRYGYDALGRANSRSITKDDATIDQPESVLFDAFGRVRMRTDALGTWDIEYLQQSSRPILVSLRGGGLRIDYGYELAPGVVNAGRLLSATYSMIAGVQANPVATAGLGYFASGEIQTSGWTTSGVAPRNVSYQYDDLARLRQATEGNVVNSFRYSRSGGLLRRDFAGMPRGYTESPGGIVSRQEGTPIDDKMRGHVSEYASVTVANRPVPLMADLTFQAPLSLADPEDKVAIKATDISSNERTTTFALGLVGAKMQFIHDVNGRRTRQISPAGVVTYEWNQADRLVAVQTAEVPVTGTRRSEFEYDVFGQLVGVREKSYDGASWTSLSDNKLLWADGALLQKRALDGSTVLRRYLADGFIDVFGAVESSFFETRDHLGSTREVVAKSSGAVVGAYDYDAFGVPFFVAGTVRSERLFTGHYFHHGSGLHLTWARAYDAQSGRWLSRDPLLYAEALPEGTNPYAYVGNDPINNFDELGLCGVTSSRGSSGGRGGPPAPPKRTAAAGGDGFGNNGADWWKYDSAAESAVPMVDRVRNVAQRSFDYAVQNPRTAGLNRMQLGKDAEVQATRWMRKWAERNGVEGLEFQVRGAKSVPDVVFDPARQIFDFKLTPKAVRPAQTLNFQNDFPGYGIDYIFGPGPWR